MDHIYALSKVCDGTGGHGFKQRAADNVLSITQQFIC